MITSNNRTNLFYGSQKITSRYLGDKLIWGKNLSAQSIPFSGKFFYYQGYPYSFYNYTVAQLQLNSSEAQLIRGKNIISVELNGKTSDVKWTFPTSGSSINKDYLVVETTTSTFTQIESKMKADYGISKSGSVNAVVYYTE